MPANMGGNRVTTKDKIAAIGAALWGVVAFVVWAFAYAVLSAAR